MCLFLAHAGGLSPSISFRLVDLVLGAFYCFSTLFFPLSRSPLSNMKIACLATLLVAEVSSVSLSSSEKSLATSLSPHSTVGDLAEAFASVCGDDAAHGVCSTTLGDLAQGADPYAQDTLHLVCSPEARQLLQRASPQSAFACALVSIGLLMTFLKFASLPGAPFLAAGSLGQWQEALGPLC